MCAKQSAESLKKKKKQGKNIPKCQPQLLFTPNVLEDYKGEVQGTRVQRKITFKLNLHIDA